jgi:predicted dehydrogenase
LSPWPAGTQRFAAELSLEASVGRYQALLASDLVDAVDMAPGYAWRNLG